MAKKHKAIPKARAATSRKKPSRKAKPAKSAGSKPRVTALKSKSPKRAFPKSRAAKPVMAKVLTGTTNLLVTYDPNHKGIAEAELKEAFSRIGERYELVHTDVEGLFKLKTQDARRVVRKLGDICRREAQALSTTHRYTPIDAWCKSE
ncbi:hypothetical protein HYY72_05930, partial [Candidatus Woesearchaeota archaeon]|nr:hypothetical protein [Candidatus Woesearchaeota archaeon]